MSATVHLPTSGVSPHLAGGNGRQVVVVVPFKDAREIRDRCGRKTHASLGIEQASAFCSSNPSEWIATLLVSELAAAGFNVVRAPATASGPHIPRIEGSLLKLFAELRRPPGMLADRWIEADIHIKLVVTSGSGLIAKRSFYAKGRFTPQVTFAFDPAVEDATRKLFKDMVASIISLLNRYPALGAQHASVHRHSDGSPSNA